MSLVINPRDDSARPVKNLGWLLRHAWEARYITLQRRGESGARMFAYMRDGHVYTTDWASMYLAQQFVKRPSLNHAITEVFA